MASCTLCDCRHYVPNQFRKTLCLKCYHGYSSHSGKPSVRYYLARIEGGFSWEQLRLWYSNGLFDDPTKILVCTIDERNDPHALPGTEVPFRLMSEAFPDPSRSFVPKGPPRAAHAPDKVSLLTGSSYTGASRPHQSGEDEDYGGANADEPGDDAGDGTPAADTVDPAEAKARAADMAELFSQGKAWYFIDAAGQTQGPFSANQMESWFRAGYFWQKSLLIGQHGWPAFETLGTLLKKCLAPAPAAFSSASKLPVAAKPGAAAPAPAAPALPLKSAAAAKATPSQARVADSAAASAAAPATQPAPSSRSTPPSAPTAALAHSAGLQQQPPPPAPASAAALQHDAHPSGAGASTAAPPTSARLALVRSLLWQYRDEADAVQGPFSALQMAEWTRHGFFDDATLLHVLGGLMPEGTWLPLGELFPDPGPDATDDEVAATFPFDSTSFIELLHRRFGGGGSGGFPS